LSCLCCSCYMPACLVLPCVILSCVAVACLALIYLALACFVISRVYRVWWLPCLAMHCLAFPCLALRCLVLSCFALPCLVLSCPVLPCLTLSLLYRGEFNQAALVVQTAWTNSKGRRHAYQVRRALKTSQRHSCFCRVERHGGTQRSGVLVLLYGKWLCVLTHIDAIRTVQEAAHARVHFNLVDSRIECVAKLNPSGFFFTSGGVGDGGAYYHKSTVSLLFSLSLSFLVVGLAGRSCLVVL
jgi:hypothetical protein